MIDGSFPPRKLFSLNIARRKNWRSLWKHTKLTFWNSNHDQIQFKPEKMCDEFVSAFFCLLWFAWEITFNELNHTTVGDIDVIAALGDSLTAASGASSVRVTDLVIENRGLSWSIGGQWSFKNSSTLPNILKGIHTFFSLSNQKCVYLTRLAISKDFGFA